jgi:CheY-like chemotaxis protein
MFENEVILLVEDNEDDVFLMRRALKSAAVTTPVRILENGQEAIDYFGGTGLYADREKHPYPSLVFLDLKLPYKSGFDVLSWLQENPPPVNLTVVVLSSSNSPHDVARCAELGASHYAVKPPDLALFHKVAELLRRR